MGLSDHKPSLAVWIVTLGVGESVTKDDFETCSRAVDRSCVPKHSYLKGEVAWRYIVGCLLPQMVMRRRHIPRNKWAFFKSKQIEGSGKPYISLNVDGSEEQLAMGFSVAEAGAAMAFTHSFGLKHQVTNIGVGIRALTPGVSTAAYVCSHLHELTSREERSIAIDATGDESATQRRLNIILSVKDAYIKAIGQPVGFDYSRIDCDVPNKMMSVDGQSLAGWHIRIFAVNLAKTPELESHKAPLYYQVAVAVFRGGHGMKFSFSQSQDDLDSFVTFFDVREVVKAVPRLGEYDNAAMPPMEKIPLSNKNSMVSVSEKEKERLREKREKEIPPLPPLPQKYVIEVKQPYSGVDVKPSLSHSKISREYYSMDVKQPLPITSNTTYPTSKGVPVPSGPAPAYTSTAKHSHTNGYSSFSASQYQPPIHTSRR